MTSVLVSGVCDIKHFLTVVPDSDALECVHYTIMTIQPDPSIQTPLIHPSMCSINTGGKKSKSTDADLIYRNIDPQSVISLQFPRPPSLLLPRTGGQPSRIARPPRPPPSAEIVTLLPAIFRSGVERIAVGVRPGRNDWWGPVLARTGKIGRWKDGFFFDVHHLCSLLGLITACAIVEIEAEESESYSKSLNFGGRVAEVQDCHDDNEDAFDERGDGVRDRRDHGKENECDDVLTEVEGTVEEKL